MGRKNVIIYVSLSRSSLLHFARATLGHGRMGDTKNWMIFTDEIIRNGQPARTSRHVCHFRFRRMSECYTSCDYDDDDNSTNTNYERVQWYYCTAANGKLITLQDIFQIINARMDNDTIVCDSRSLAAQTHTAYRMAWHPYTRSKWPNFGFCFACDIQINYHLTTAIYRITLVCSLCLSMIPDYIVMVMDLNGRTWNVHQRFRQNKWRSQPGPFHFLIKWLAQQISIKHGINHCLPQMGVFDSRGETSIRHWIEDKKNDGRSGAFILIWESCTNK